MARVSIIIPCYNSARYLGRTIESVLAQTFVDWAQIVVDDGSTDGSADIARAFAGRDRRIQVITQPNRGVSSARNAGFRASDLESRYLLFLDADDCLEPSMLEVMIAYLDEHPDVGMAHCGPVFIDADDNVLDAQQAGLGWSPRYVPSRLGVRKLPDDHAETPFVSVFSLAGLIPSVSVMRRSVYVQTPGWDETLGHIYEDTDLFLHMALRGRVHYVPQPLVRHRRHREQSTADPKRVAVQERKLYAKWRSGAGLTPEQQATVFAAWRFRQGRVMPLAGVAAGTRHLAQGRVAAAARFYLGAARHYLLSLAPRGWA